MNDRLMATIVKELLVFWRDPKSRNMILLMPIIQVLVFAFAATLEVRNIDVALLDHDQGRWSHEFVARLGSASFVDEIVEVKNLREMGDMIVERDVVLGIHMLPDFSRAVTAGDKAAVQVLLDGRRANAAQISFSYLNAIASDLGAELSVAAMPQSAPPRALVRHWFNPNLEYVWFIVPSLAAVMAMMTPLMMTSLSIARERELGTYDQLLVSPVSAFEIIAGKIIPGVASGMFIAGVITLLAVFGFGIPYVGTPLYYLASMLVFSLAVAGTGLTISSLCRTQQQAILGTFISVIPIMLISGFVTPVDNMPGWLQVAAEASPLKHFLVVVQGSFLKAMTAAQIWSNTWPMILIASVTLGAATTVVRQGMR
jgi:ABC-2 type transport system permease protein